MNRFIDINPERCIGCGTCQSACADAHRMQGLQDTPRLALVKTGGISAALACHHCVGAPCAEVCPVNAIEHDGDRIHVKEQECIGCRLCAIACPFGAIHPDGTSIAGVAGMCDPTPSYPKSLSSLLTWLPASTPALSSATCAPRSGWPALCGGVPHQGADRHGRRGRSRARRGQAPALDRKRSGRRRYRRGPGPVRESRRERKQWIA